MNTVLQLFEQVIIIGLIWRVTTCYLERWYLRALLRAAYETVNHYQRKYQQAVGIASDNYRVSGRAIERHLLHALDALTTQRQTLEACRVMLSRRVLSPGELRRIEAGLLGVVAGRGNTGWMETLEGRLAAVQEFFGANHIAQQSEHSSCPIPRTTRLEKRDRSLTAHRQQGRIWDRVSTWSSSSSLQALCG